MKASLAVFPAHQKLWIQESMARALLAYSRSHVMLLDPRQRDKQRTACALRYVAAAMLNPGSDTIYKGYEAAGEETDGKIGERHCQHQGAQERGMLVP